jgi:hypothetical protein
MPFKQYRIIAIEPCGHTSKDYKGFYTEDMLFVDTYLLTIEKKTWWGLKQQIVKITTEVSKGYRIYDWWEQKFKGWVIKLPLKYQP